MRFRVTVRDRAGKRLTVYREAENGSALARTLSKEGLFAVEIAEDREGSRGTGYEPVRKLPVAGGLAANQPRLDVDSDCTRAAGLSHASSRC